MIREPTRKYLCVADMPSVPPPRPCVWLLLRPGSNRKASLCWDWRYQKARERRDGDRRQKGRGRGREGEGKIGSTGTEMESEPWTKRDRQKDTHRETHKDSDSGRERAQVEKERKGQVEKEGPGSRKSVVGHLGESGRANRQKEALPCPLPPAGLHPDSFWVCPHPWGTDGGPSSASHPLLHPAQQGCLGLGALWRRGGC